MDWKIVMKNSVPEEEEILQVLAEEKDRMCAVLLDGEKGLPLVALSTDTNDGRTLMVKSRGDNEFLNIFAREGERFTFRVTNFTHHDVFFLLHHGADFDKGKAVNKINILAPQRTYVLEGDYSNDEKEMFLDVQKGVTVAADEAKGDKRKGTYFSFKVCPTKSNLDWSTAVWTSPDYLCLPKEKFPPGNGFRIQGGGGDCAFREGVGCTFGGFSPAAAPGGGWGSGGGFGSSEGGFSYTPAAASGGGWGSGGGFGDSVPAAASGGFGASACSFSFGSPVPAAASPIPPAENFSKDDVFATQLRHGQVHQAASQRVSMAVYFEHAAPVATFCMAVMPPDKVTHFDPLTHNQRMTLMLEAIYEFRVSHNKKLLESIRTVHKEKECCICMDAVPAFIFIKCGHGAVCGGCAPKMREQRCPLCRAFIEGKINL